MDPNATYMNLQSELRVGNGDEAYEFAVALRKWLKSNGFLPSNTPFTTREQLVTYLTGICDAINSTCERM